MSWTNLQREQGHKEIEAYRNQALAEQYHTEMTSLQNGYNQLRDEIEACNKEAERLKELGDDKGAQVQLDKVKGKTVELNAVMEKLKSTHALEVLAEEAGHLKDVMEEANDKFKQATEDGLLDFMTDGVNAVLDGTKTIEDAFADMAISILKTMQKFFADKIVTGLMNQWFGNTTTQSLMSPFAYNPEAQWQWSKNPDYVAQQNDKELAQFNREGYYITNLPEGGAEEAKQLYKDKQWTPEYANADLGVRDITATTVNLTAQTVNGAEPQAVSSSTTDVSNANINVGTATTTVGSETSTVGSQNTTVGTQTATVGTSSTTIGAETSTVGTQQSTVGTQQVQAGNVLLDGATAMGHATGGYITGPGTGTSDSIPARLSNGEFVIRSEAVKRYGTNFLNAVNDGTFARIHTKVPRFAEGGLVEEATNNVGNNMAQSMGGVIGQHMSNTATFNVALVRDEQEAMASFMRSSHGQRIMLDFSKKYANVTRSF